MLTPEQNRWTRITEAKGWLDLFRPLSADVASELRSRFEVRLTHHSTAIEGNTLTQSETQIVLEKGITIGGKSLIEHLEVIGHQEALGFVSDLARGEGPLTEREIREIHALVVKGQGHTDAGAYRTLDVMAAGTEYRYPSHLKVPELMAEFRASLTNQAEHPVKVAARAHLDFVTIHPFRDGNGRVARLLLNLLLLRAGYPLAVIPVTRRSEYIESLVAAQQGQDATMWESLVLDAVESSLRESLEVCLSAAGSPEIPADTRTKITRWITAD